MGEYRVKERVDGKEQILEYFQVFDEAKHYASHATDIYDDQLIRGEVDILMTGAYFEIRKNSRTIYEVWVERWDDKTVKWICMNDPGPLPKSHFLE